jgi:hypothetical protein
MGATPETHEGQHTAKLPPLALGSQWFTLGETGIKKTREALRLAGFRALLVKACQRTGGESGRATHPSRFASKINRLASASQNFV